MPRKKVAVKKVKKKVVKKVAKKVVKKTKGATKKATKKEPKKAKKPAKKDAAKKSPVDNKNVDADLNKSAIVRKLIRAGKDKGYISYDEVNDMLPDDVVASDEIDGVITALQEANIKVVESSEEVEKIPLAVKRDQKKIKTRKFVQIDDPVKMYLKQMGQIPLLSRNEELELAKTY